MNAFFKRGSAAAAAPATASPRSAGLANFAVPPFPTPLPHRLISLHITPSGLIIAPRDAAAAAAGAAPSASHSRNRSRSDSISYALHSEDGSVEDVANDARRATAAAAAATRAGVTGGVSPEAGARVGWGRGAKVEALTPADVRTALAGNAAGEQGNEILAYGVVGLLRVFNEAYLFVITSRTQAGDFLHPSLPVYRCSGVLAIPLSRPKALATFREELQRQAGVPAPRPAGSSEEETSDSDAAAAADDDSDGDVVTPSIIGREEFLATSSRPTASATLRPQKARMWLGRKERAAVSENGVDDEGAGLAEGSPAEIGQPDEVDLPDVAAPTPAQELTSDQRWHEANKAELEDKVVKETARQYARGAMWFSYDFDLLTSLQRKQELCEGQDGQAPKRGSSTTPAKAKRNALPFEEPNRTLPLWRRVERRFWHNEHLCRDFVDAGIHSLILPLMQGYFQVASLPIDLEPGSPLPTSDVAGDAMEAASAAASSERIEAWLLLVSRRSKERAGLRYQRRGIDDEGHVANFVETEQVLLVRKAGQVHLQAFLQWRGSIPQYWRQDPFNIKPPPILEGSRDENRSACSKHFEAQVKRYGTITCVNLAEQSGKEGQITEAYRSAVEDELKRDDVRYHAFDFHHVCAGMKFERVSLLIDEMRDTLEQMASFWRVAPKGLGEGGEEVLSRQRGTFRVSCLDCLDRTNVVQSAFARHVLESQLQRVGIALPCLANRAERDEAFDFAFNDSWANNGDAISATYAGTNALKGDFTRTGQRNFRGMMNDATNSLWRTVQGAVTDFFKQTVMDFQYGRLSLAGLERYGDELNTKDPNEGSRLRRVRANAIETCGPLVMGKGEEKLAAWTLFSPVEANRVHSAKLEEKVVILSNKALYVCGYDFQSEKLAEFSRVLIGDITGMTKGLYIISPKEGYHPENHWGFTVSFLSQSEEKRLNNASVRNVPRPKSVGAGGSKEGFYAFRVVVEDFAGTVERSGEGRGTPAAAAAAAATPSAAGRNFFKRSRSADKARPSSSSTSNSTEGPSSSAQTSSLVTFATPETPSELTSHDIVDRIVSLIAEECAAAGAFTPSEEAASSDPYEGFVKSETIQSLAQAKANASLFAPLIEGLKRRVWL